MTAELSLIIGGDTLSASVDVGWHLLGATLDTSTGSAWLYLDGVDEAGGTVSAELPAASLYPLQMGGQTVSGGLIGVSVPQDLAEVIVVPAALSDDDRQKLEGYLAHKWALADLLPDDHPYKAAPPVVEIPEPPAPPEPPKADDSSRLIITPAKGQTWGSLALRYYYDEAQMTRLLEANPQLAGLLIFTGAESIAVPIVSDDALSADVDKTPPWRR